jgi:4-diphosphocytidyl-2C-methyl-D-erythritol kinase
MSKIFLSVFLAVSLSGCAGLTTYVLAHKEAFAVTAILSGTGQSVLGLFNQADEAEKRIEKRVSDGNP